jgi:hypothetical protein
MLLNALEAFAVVRIFLMVRSAQSKPLNPVHDEFLGFQ